MAQFTKKAIIQTFQEMLEKTPFEKITVSAIVAKCEISPNTFYYHFQDIYDLLDVWIRIKRENYLNMISEEKTWKDVIRIALGDLRMHSDIVYHLIDSLSAEHIERCIYESADEIFNCIVVREIGDIGISETEIHEIAEYNGYAFVGYFIKFLRNGMSGDVEAGIEKTSLFFEENIRRAIEKHKKIQN